MERDIYVVIEHLQGKVSDISYTMLAAANEFAKINHHRVVGILLGHNAQPLAADLKSDQILYFDHPVLDEFNPEAYQITLSSVIQENKPFLVLFGSTSIGADIASVVAGRLDLPIVSACQKLLPDKMFQSKICGGKIIVEGFFSEKTTILTMLPGGYKPEDAHTLQSPDLVTGTVPSLDGLRIKLSRYHDPDLSDVDISKENLLIAVGRGIQTEDNIELAEELAEIMNATVCASRPVVDQGWMPTTRLVGRSGKTVKPKVYFALGISGAPEHTEGILDSNTIIAVNTDPNAPIFEIADYGAEIDALDLLEVLIEEMEEMKV